MWWLIWSTEDTDVCGYGNKGIGREDIEEEIGLEDGE